MINKLDESGMTLIELLLVVVLLAIVMGGISQAVLVTITNTEHTSNRLVLSRDAQITSAYFVSDAQSATSVDLGLSIPAPWNSPTNCGLDPQDSQSLVSFEWLDVLDEATSASLGTSELTKVAFYYYKDIGSGTSLTERQLVRRYCELDDAGIPLLIQGTTSNSHDTVLNHFLKEPPVVDVSNNVVTMSVSTCVPETRSASTNKGQCGEGAVYDYVLEGLMRSGT